MKRSIVKEDGFSLSELLIVIALLMIFAGIAVPTFNEAMERSDADAAAQLIAQELNMARARAIGTRVGVLVQADVNNNSIVVAPGTGSVRGPFPLPGDTVLLGVAPATDTPDGLGGTILGVGANDRLTFIDNGAAATDATGANLVSGTFFLRNRAEDPETLRAVTLVGGTGRARIWRFDSESGTWR